MLKIIDDELKHLRLTNFRLFALECEMMMNRHHQSIRQIPVAIGMNNSCNEINRLSAMKAKVSIENYHCPLIIKISHI